MLLCAGLVMRTFGRSKRTQSSAAAQRARQDDAGLAKEGSAGVSVHDCCPSIPQSRFAFPPPKKHLPRAPFRVGMPERVSRRSACAFPRQGKGGVGWRAFGPGASQPRGHKRVPPAWLGQERAFLHPSIHPCCRVHARTPSTEHRRAREHRRMYVRERGSGGRPEVRSSAPTPTAEPGAGGATPFRGRPQDRRKTCCC